MSLNRFPILCTFLSTTFSDTDAESDEATTQVFAQTSSRDRKTQIIEQIRLLLNQQKFSLEELGTQANRWFSELEEAQAWLRKVLEVLEAGQGSETSRSKADQATSKEGHL